MIISGDEIGEDDGDGDREEHVEDELDEQWEEDDDMDEVDMGDGCESHDDSQLAFDEVSWSGVLWHNLRFLVSVVATVVVAVVVVVANTVVIFSSGIVS